jgi:hypothetical protein
LLAGIDIEGVFMPEERFKIPALDWERAVDELYGLLVDVARRQETITYSETVVRLSAVRLDPEAYAFHAMLGEVSERTFDEGGTLLSAVVVHKGDGRPGGGFCDLARHLGFSLPDDSVAEDVFWAQQLEAVHKWWRRK